MEIDNSIYKDYLDLFTAGAGGNLQFNSAFNGSAMRPDGVYNLLNCYWDSASLNSQLTGHWITYYEDENLKILFDNIPIVEDVPIQPNIPKKAQKAILKKPYRLKNGISIKVVYMKDEYCLFIPSGYRWNGANIPFGLYHLIGSPSDPRFKVASMVHDFLCENRHIIDYNRYLSTKIFEALLSEAGVSKFKRFLMFHAVDNYQKFQKWSIR